MRPASVKAALNQVAGASYVPVAGKTYSLFGNDLSTEPYYDRIRRLADELLRIVPGEESLLALIRRSGGRKRLLAKVARREDGSALSSILQLLGNARLHETEDPGGRNPARCEPVYALDGPVRGNLRQPGAPERTRDPKDADSEDNHAP